MHSREEDEIEIDLQELFGLLLHWAWLIILCGIVAAVAGLLICKLAVTPMYKSSTRVFILNKDNNNATISYSDLQTSSQLTKDYAHLIKGRTVLEQVLETCELEESYESFSNRVAVETISDSRLISITVTDPDPRMAQLLAKEIRVVASEHIMQVMEIQAVNLETEANLPTHPSSPSTMKWTAVGGLLGAFVCAMILIIQFLLDDTIKSAEDVEKYLGLSTLAMIPVRETAEKNRKKKEHREHFDPALVKAVDEQEGSGDVMDVVVQELNVGRKEEG